MRTKITSAVVLSLALPTLLGFLGGCATQRVTYEKQGITQADRQRDENECLRAAIGPEDRAQILVPYTVDRETYGQCMEARGYTRRS